MKTAYLGPVLLEAITAAENGTAPAPVRAAAVLEGGSTLRLEDLDYDSLAWMEFCISIELQTGLELTPDLLEQFETLADVAGWIADKRSS